MGLIRNLHGLLPVEKTEKLGWCDTLLTVFICTENYLKKQILRRPQISGEDVGNNFFLDPGKKTKKTLTGTWLEESSHSWYWYSVIF
jgi:hypothetical protein